MFASGFAEYIVRNTRQSPKAASWLWLCWGNTAQEHGSRLRVRLVFIQPPGTTVSMSTAKASRATAVHQYLSQVTNSCCPSSPTHYGTPRQQHRTAVQCQRLHVLSPLIITLSYCFHHIFVRPHLSALAYDTSIIRVHRIGTTAVVMLLY